MCGISGILYRHPTGARVDSARVSAMLSAMAHRGPDGDGVYACDRLAMAVNRLAIRGVEAPQPPLMVHPSGIVVACNGEIDNHRELREILAQRGHVIDQTTDVAVIAPLYLEYGPQFLEHLQGVFAIALWDAPRKQLLLARDRAGERHLLYALSDDAVCFASELSGLVAAMPTPPQLDRESLPHYLQSGFCPSHHSLLAHHHKLQPGEVIVIDAAGARHEHYWKAPIGVTPKSAPDMAAFDDILRGAVLRQTDIDVDYGVLLSGGVDSALVTAIARAVRPERKLTAYCVRFAETSFDEGQHAADVAQQLGCDFVPVTLQPDDVPGRLHKLIAATGEPLADPAWMAQSLVTERASQDVHLLLAGEGADELFGGYPTYLGARLHGRFERLPASMRAGIRRLVSALPVSDKKMTVSFLLKQFVHGPELDGFSRHLLWNARISPEWLRRLGFDPPGDQGRHTACDLMDAIQHYDFTHSLPDALLAKADRGSMCHAVEIRGPYLDRQVIEFAATLPVEWRVRGLTTKVFLKAFAQRYLPTSVVHQRKRGLSIPLCQWLHGPLHGWATQRLSASVLADAGIDTTTALALLDEHTLRRADHSRAIWVLVVLSEWLEWLAQQQRASVDLSRRADARPPRVEAAPPARSLEASVALHANFSG
ncbi:asparagine synthase (glutamine-hydrolyzing) [Dyella solisilvae]|uniref:asparagine synthase (glutamine-hydrolyzing) n=1 Tax=Dyella solisilvae TaxID=1920168 RepID=A0A370K4X5_9GAMM|nr:asparagine synthase (glutamine-hydrolyzing) [Dyella solisilvae]RDI97487.1 asparagine synthase (glutamine-hydrolyzing) [Dyella solisilvae]